MKLFYDSRIVFNFKIDKNLQKSIKKEFLFAIKEEEIQHLYGVYTDAKGKIYRASHSKESFDYNKSIPIKLLTECLKIK